MAGRNGSPDRGAVSEADGEVDWLSDSAAVRFNHSPFLFNGGVLRVTSHDFSTSRGVPEAMSSL